MRMLVLGILAMLMSGCTNSSDPGGKEDNASVESAEDAEKIDDMSPEEAQRQELLGWLKEAAEQQAKESVWGYKEKNTIIYENGEKEENEGSKTVDSQKQIVMYRYHFATNDQIDFYTREGDKEYQYVQDSKFDDEKGEYVDIFLKVLLEEENTGYTFMAAPVGFSFEDSETMEYADYSLTDEGEEDGTVKIKVTEKFKLKDHFAKVTRESVLEENGWTEEDVQAIEGASKALDAYIEENDKNIENLKDKEYERTTYYWLTKDEHRFVKSEGDSFIVDSEDEARAKFNAISWKIDTLRSEVENGKSREEAVEQINEMESDEAEPWPEIKKSTYYYEYVTGEDCVPMEELPKDVKEITWEQYMNGEY